jgi:HAE1 family hydrophobic/amphiphilic exporter-1
VALVSGIQGRLNKQFAVTIAVSVVISAFNALTLSPALAALMLRPRKEARGPLARPFAAFNRWFAKATRGYVSLSRGLIRKAVIAVFILVGFAAVDGFFGNRLPTSFLPEEDYGFLFLNIQLPPAASLERTDQVSRKVGKILKETDGVQFVTSINGFSLLNRVSASYNGFCFISLQPWGERKPTAAEILKSINGRLASEVPEAVAFAFMPPAIPGLGNSGGFSFWLQDDIRAVSTACSTRSMQIENYSMQS